MALEIEWQQYGKAKVRFVKVVKSADRHDFLDFNVQLQLDGKAFYDTYFSGDNSKIVPTDTQKNIVWFVAKNYSFSSLEEYCLILADFVKKRYNWAEKVVIQATENIWERLSIDGKAHPHTFVGKSNGPNTLMRKVFLEKTDRETVMKSGWVNYKILKTTGSEFVAFNKCDLTTLPEEKDRFMGTNATIEWTWRSFPADPRKFLEISNSVVAITSKYFANTYSLSLQQTMYECAKIVLSQHSELLNLHYTMPNLHNMPIRDIKPVNRPNEIVLHPQDEPHGNLQVTFGRGSKSRL